jgi:hypothetical protein
MSWPKHSLQRNGKLTTDTKLCDDRAAGKNNRAALLRGQPHMMKVLAGIDREQPLRWAKAKDKLERAVKLAHREVDDGFPVLYGQAAIALWSSLEALIRSLVAQWLANTPGAWQVDAVTKLHVKLGDYESLDRDERCLWITDLIDQEVSGPLRNGVDRFESLLQPFGLSGSVDPEGRKTLFELSQIRHVLVHRNGTVDKRLVDACPWLGLKAGDHLVVTSSMWEAYSQTLARYVDELIQRVRVRFDLGRGPTFSVRLQQTIKKLDDAKTD